MRATFLLCLFYFWPHTAFSASERFHYTGVLGSEDQAIAVITDTASDKTLFVKVGEYLPHESLKVLRASRREITLVGKNGPMVLTPQGSTITRESEQVAETTAVANFEERSAELKSMIGHDSEHLEEKLVEEFEVLIQLGSDLVDQGVMTIEEANAVIAEQNRQLQNLGLSR